jgi:hypothetical protein
VWSAFGKEDDSSYEGICSCREEGSVVGSRKMEKELCPRRSNSGGQIGWVQGQIPRSQNSKDGVQ